MALTTYAQQRFTLMREYPIGKRLVEGYLHQPFEVAGDLKQTDASQRAVPGDGGRALKGLARVWL